MSWLFLLACLSSTLFMTGVIWFVHVVHYPLFDQISGDSFTKYHANHTRATTFVVLVPMVIELFSGLMLVIQPPSGVSAWLVWVGLGLAVSTWATTFFFSVPAHGRLASGFDPAVLRTLMRTNRLRVLSWTAHSVVVLMMISSTHG